MKIVLDTNVLVSAFHSRLGNPARIVRLSLEGRHTLHVDVRIMNEYREVLSRPGWPFRVEDALAVLDALLEGAQEVVPAPVALRLPDPDDVCFLEVAIAAGAVLITGNKRHYPPSASRGARVLSPREFLDLAARDEV